MSTANEFQIEIVISLTDCNIDNISYLLPTAAKRSIQFVTHTLLAVNCV